MLTTSGAKLSLILYLIRGIWGNFVAERPKLEQNRIKLELYYETLCPDSLRFLEDQLYPLLKESNKYQHDPVYTPTVVHLDLHLITYGKAKTSRGKANDEKRLLFQCQHGPLECEGNLMHSCVINTLLNVYPNLSAKLLFEFLTCSMNHLMNYPTSTANFGPKSSKNGQNSARIIAESAYNICIEDIGGLESFEGIYKNDTLMKGWKVEISHKIKSCLGSNEGLKLLERQGELTDELKPKLFYVPWIVFNGKWSYSLMQRSFSNLSNVLCQLAIERSTLAGLSEVQQQQEIICKELIYEPHLFFSSSNTRDIFEDKSPVINFHVANHSVDDQSNPESVPSALVYRDSRRINDGTQASSAYVRSWPRDLEFTQSVRRYRQPNKMYHRMHVVKTTSHKRGYRRRKWN